jgi:imidazolonepropionase-like amidohydrolase
MHDRGVALNPTLWVFAERQPKDAVSAQRIAWQNAATQRAAALGVSLVAGTDDMFDASRDSLPFLHRELEQLVTGAGLSPLDAIVAATRNAARALGAESRGTIEAGKAADVVLLEANPVDDIRNTRKIRAVIKNGHLARGQ